jgi:hypothetical protein
MSGEEKRIWGLWKGVSGSIYRFRDLGMDKWSPDDDEAMTAEYANGLEAENADLRRQLEEARDSDLHHTDDDVHALQSHLGELQAALEASDRAVSENAYDRDEWIRRCKEAESALASREQAFFTALDTVLHEVLMETASIPGVLKAELDHVIRTRVRAALEASDRAVSENAYDRDEWIRRCKEAESALASRESFEEGLREAFAGAVTSAVYIESRRKARVRDVRCRALYPRPPTCQCEWIEGHLGPHNYLMGNDDYVWGGDPAKIIPSWLEYVVAALSPILPGRTGNPSGGRTEA